MNSVRAEYPLTVLSTHLRLVGLIVVLLIVTLLCGCSTPQAASVDVGDRQYSFWPQFPSEPHVQFLVAYRLTSDIEEKRSDFENLIYGEDTGVLPITKPYGIEMRNGKIYVCDIKNPNLIVLDLIKKETRVMTTSGLGGMSQPTDVAIASDGMIYVADAAKGVIFVFDRNERHVNSFGHQGFKPVSLSVHGNELFVSDHITQSVLVMDRNTGAVLRTIGGPGAEDGKFIKPQGIDVDSQGNLFVSDVIKCRLQQFDSQGELLNAVGTTGDTAGSFVRPKHLAIDSLGIVYVVDSAFDNVQMFNDQGQVLMFFGSAGSHPGAMNLPAGICINETDIELFREYIHPAFDAERLVLVTNQFGGNKIEVFAVGQLRKDKTIDDISTNISAMESGVQDSEEDINPLTADIPEVGGDTKEDVEQEAESDSP